MFKEVASFTSEYQLSRTHCASVYADVASGMIRIKNALWIHEKGKQKHFGTYCLLRREKIRQGRNLGRSDSFWIDFICCQSHQKSSIMHSLIWCFVWRDGGRTQWAFVSFEHPLVHEERCWREWPTQWHRCVIKWTESQFCWTIQWQQVDCQIL